MGDKSKSIAEQINFGNNYGDTTGNGPGMMSYLKALFSADGGSEGSRPRQVPKTAKESPRLVPKTARETPRPVAKARGGMVKKRGKK